MQNELSRPTSLLHRPPLSYFCLLSVPRRNFLQFFPFLVHCCFCCWNFHSSRHTNKFVHQIAVLWWILSFSKNMVFMMMRHRIFHTHSRRFIRFQNARKFCYNLIGSTTPPISYGHSWLFLWIPCLPGRRNRSLENFECFQDGTFHQTTFASPSNWRPFPLTSRVLAINDLAWMYAALLLISSQTTYIRPEVFCK